MTVVTQGSPPATPDETKRLTQLAQLMPEPARHAITLYAEHVDIERKAYEMRAPERARTARVHQLALLGLAAYGRCDSERDAQLPADPEEVVRVLTDYRMQALGDLGSAQPRFFDSPHEYFPDEGPPW